MDDIKAITYKISIKDAGNTVNRESYNIIEKCGKNKESGE
jgi:hypothetical protein